MTLFCPSRRGESSLSTAQPRRAVESSQRCRLGPRADSVLATSYRRSTSVPTQTFLAAVSRRVHPGSTRQTTLTDFIAQSEPDFSSSTGNIPERDISRADVHQILLDSIQRATSLLLPLARLDDPPPSSSAPDSPLALVLASRRTESHSLSRAPEDALLHRPCRTVLQDGLAATSSSSRCARLPLAYSRPQELM